MKYEIVELDQKTVAGKSIETSNNDPKMQEKIGKLWMELYDYKTGYYSKIKNKVKQNAIGLYSDYKDDKYCVTVGAEVSRAENPEYNKKIIKKGRYAKFSVHGNMITAVAEAWGEIWAMPLDRSYTGDFEEYLECDCDKTDECDVETCSDCNIDIYIALK